MKKYWQAIGITVVVAGALVYPAMRLYKYLAAKRAQDDGNDDGKTHVIKSFLPAFRGKRKHHRTEHNGNGAQTDPGLGLA